MRVNRSLTGTNYWSDEDIWRNILAFKDEKETGGSCGISSPLWSRDPWYCVAPQGNPSIPGYRFSPCPA